MTQRSDQVSLRQMLDYSRKAVAMVEGRAEEDLTTDEMLCLALTRVVEIIGEAATRVSQAGQQRHTHVPWSQIIGLRNRLVHGYDAVDMEILWDIVQQDLPPLIESLEKIVADEA
jgi:uncharacterized protein with HEPN domain